MKKAALILITIFTILSSSDAQNIVNGITVNNFKIERNGNYIVVDMTMDLKDLKVESNRAVLLTPCLRNVNDSTELASVGIYGRKRYYFYVRNGESMLTGDNERSYKASQKPDSLVYHEILPYKDWMNAASLSIHRSDYGCCGSVLAEEEGMLGQYTEAVAFFPELLYVRPEADSVKMRSVSGRAYIDFPVDQTVIYNDYRRNEIELQKIHATIDTVRNDRDVVIKMLSLKGYASPEGTYAHNTDLAIGRTAALKNHIKQLYKFDDRIISTSYEPEDWEGLREYVEKSNIDNRNEILEIIDNSLKPDAKELQLRRKYPAAYQFLLKNCYPGLRHTDYSIQYTVRTYSEVNEIKQIMAKRPQNLSLNEFYLLSKEYEPGTHEFTEVFETAVRMFPEDETANLNAANAAIRHNDFENAKKYLAKAGHSAEAVYARGVYAYLNEDYEEARTLMNNAKAMGINEAQAVLEKMK